MQLSYSAADRYINSPLSYFLHYFLRLRPIQLSSPLIFGGAIDEGLNTLLNQKKDGLAIDLAAAKKKFILSLIGNDVNAPTMVKGVVKFSKADLDLDLIKDLLIPEEHDPAWYSLQRKGELILEAYAEQIIPKLEKVLLVQHEISLPNEVGDTLTGIIDLVAQIDGKIYILDNKTSSIKYAEDAVAVSAQLGTYYEALKDEYDLAGAGFIIIPKNLRKKKLPLVPIEIKLGQVDEKVIQETFQMYENVLEGVKMGRFECSGCDKKPWPCVYARYCESGGTDMTGLKIEEKRK